MRLAPSVKLPSNWMILPALANSRYVAFGELPHCGDAPEFFYEKSTMFGEDLSPVFRSRGNILATSLIRKEISFLGSSFTRTQLKNFLATFANLLLCPGAGALPGSSTTCALFLSGNQRKCAECSKVSKYAHESLKRRSQHDPASPSSRAKLESLNPGQLLQRYRRLRQRVLTFQTSSKKKLHRAGDELKLLKEALVTSRSKDGFESFEEPCRTFLRQIAVLASQNTHQRRYHPLIIEHCLEMHFISPRSYRYLRDVQRFPLPSERTLRGRLKKLHSFVGLTDQIIFTGSYGP